MKLLVTGGAGVIGYWVARRLVEDGHDLELYDVALGNPLLASLAEERATRVRGDASDVERLRQVATNERVERIIHLAMIIEAEHAPGLAARVAVQGLSAASVYGSASAEYCHPTYRAVGEDHPKRPRGVYGVSKLLAEEVGRAYEKKYGVRFVALRFASTYGLGKLSGRHSVFSLSSQMVESAVGGRPFSYPRGGEQRQDRVCTTRDIAQGVALAATVPAHSVHPVATSVTVSVFR